MIVKVHKNDYAQFVLTNCIVLFKFPNSIFGGGFRMHYLPKMVYPEVSNVIETDFIKIIYR